MFKSWLRNTLIFLAGAEAFHTFIHIFLAYEGLLPLDLKFMILSPTMNVLSIISNGFITIMLIWLAVLLSKQENS